MAAQFELATTRTRNPFFYLVFSLMANNSGSFLQINVGTLNRSF